MKFLYNYYQLILVIFTICFFVIFIYWGLSSTTKEMYHTNIVKGYKYHEIKEFDLSSKHFDEAEKYSTNASERNAALKGAIYSYISMNSTKVCSRLKASYKLHPDDKENQRLIKYIRTDKKHLACDL